MSTKHLYVHFLTIILLVVAALILVRPSSQGPVMVSGFTNALAEMITYAAA